MKKCIISLLSIALLLLALCGCGKQRMALNHISEDVFYEKSTLQTKVTDEQGNSYYAEDRLKVISYNIRYTNDKNGHSIKERAPRLKKVLEKYDADLLGIQEFTPKWEKHLPLFEEQYDYVLNYRSSEDVEAAPIFWKRSKFKLLDHGLFWLSETPEQESRGWGAKHWRICQWVKLENRQSGSAFYFLNTHFDFEDAPQVGSARLLIEKAQTDFKDAPVIITGDFNMERQSEGYYFMSRYFTDVNMATEQSNIGTYTGYGETSELIDYTFISQEGIKPLTYRVMTEMFDGKYVSDHYGIYTEQVLLKNN
ncbi:MAG: endonuclease/exonuclease/phosphatase family protein [Clostridia bacterium]|nr:endonuclease/exonuclease/phosphatase family protein [Clostridia bacterium]